MIRQLLHQGKKDCFTHGVRRLASEIVSLRSYRRNSQEITTHCYDEGEQPHHATWCQSCLCGLALVRKVSHHMQSVCTIVLKRRIQPPLRYYKNRVAALFRDGNSNSIIHRPSQYSTVVQYDL